MVIPFAVDEQLHREEGSIFDLDKTALCRSDQPIATVALATKYGSEELDEGQAADGRPAIKPGPVASDPHSEIATIDRRPFSPGDRRNWWGIADFGDFSHLRTCAEF